MESGSNVILPCNDKHRPVDATSLLWKKDGYIIAHDITVVTSLTSSIVLDGTKLLVNNITTSQEGKGRY